MFEFSRGNYAQKTNEILEATRGLSSTNTEGTHLIECLRSHLEAVTEEMELIRKERDEARREVCHLMRSDDYNEPFDGTVFEYATHRGWDCFKNAD